MLEFIVFCSGALVMVLEMVGGRILAPHVGTSAIVWTSLIGVVLALLALGAWAGGRYADKNLSPRGLGMALLGAAAGSALTAFFHNAIGGGITSTIGNLYVAAVAASLCCFAVPAFFFGMITPYVIRLRLGGLGNAGATVGRLYALSTAGSIAGTFLGGFALISWFASSAILWGVAVAMLLLSLLCWRKKALPRLCLLAAFVFFAWQDMAYARWQEEKTGLRLLESPYNVIRIFEGADQARGGARVRMMATDPAYTQSGMLVDAPDDLYFNYTRFYALGPALRPDAKKILMLGGGGYSVPKWLLAGKSLLAGKDFDLTVVELDPRMTEAAGESFGLRKDERLSIRHEDARSFLNSNRQTYDLIFVDVFNSHYSIPFHVGTREAAAGMARALSPGGVLLMNVISAVEGEDGRLLRAIYRAMRSAFPHVRLYLVGRPDNPGEVQNLMLMASHRELPPAAPGFAPGADPGPEELRRMEERLYSGNIPADVPPLTDDFAPVDRYTLMLTRH